MPLIAPSPMPPKFAGNPPHFALGVGQHAAVVRGFLHFVRRPRLCETLLQVVERVGANRTSLTAKHHESYGTVELRNFSRRECARDFFGETKPGNAATLTITLLHVIIDLDIAIADHDMIGQTIESLPHIERDEQVSVHSKPGRSKLLHGSDAG